MNYFGTRAHCWPVVTGHGGNAGAQSLAVVMRGIVMRKIPRVKILPRIVKESQRGIINGVIIGVVTAMVAWVWYGNPYPELVIGLGMLFNLLFPAWRERPFHFLCGVSASIRPRVQTLF